MTIGVDIDDTITNSHELIIKYAKEYFCTDDMVFINNIFHVAKIDNELFSFYDKYIVKMINEYTLKDNIKEVIERLSEKGHNVIIITARFYTPFDGVIEATKNYFKKHKFNVDKIVFRDKSKVKACKENKVDLMIDDSIEIVKKLK